jgi:hypothetical protein
MSRRRQAYRPLIWISAPRCGSGSGSGRSEHTGCRQSHRERFASFHFRCASKAVANNQHPARTKILFIRIPQRLSHDHLYGTTASFIFMPS